MNQQNKTIQDCAETKQTQNNPKFPLYPINIWVMASPVILLFVIFIAPYILGPIISTIDYSTYYIVSLIMGALCLVEAIVMAYFWRRSTLSIQNRQVRFTSWIFYVFLLGGLLLLSICNLLGCWYSSLVDMCMIEVIVSLAVLLYMRTKSHVPERNGYLHSISGIILFLLILYYLWLIFYHSVMEWGWGNNNLDHSLYIISGCISIIGNVLMLLNKKFGLATSFLGIGCYIDACVIYAFDHTYDNFLWQNEYFLMITVPIVFLFFCATCMRKN